jgi:hypothetical protein
MRFIITDEGGRVRHAVTQTGTASWDDVPGGGHVLRLSNASEQSETPV